MEVLLEESDTLEAGNTNGTIAKEIPTEIDVSLDNTKTQLGPTKLNLSFAIFEPPKATMDWYKKVLRDGPGPSYGQTLKSVSWLNHDLKEEIEQQKPGMMDMNHDGTYKADALAEKASQVFVIGRKFFNAYQMKEFITEFSNAWGFSVSMEGSSIKCFYSMPKKKQTCSKVSPSKQRKARTTVKAINCQFEVKFTRDDRKQEKAHGRIAAVITISQVHLLHSCSPGYDARAVACQKGGKNTLSSDAVKSLLHFTSHGYIHNSSIRNFCRQFLGPDIDLSGQTLYNIRKRCIYLANKYPQFMTEGISSKEVKKLHMDLDANEESNFQLFPGIAAACQRIRSQILNESGSGWKVTQVLAELKLKSSGFDYRIHYDSSSRPIGVCWVTKYMRHLWIRYGDILFLDCKKKDMNTLYWPYIGPTVVNNENKIGVVVESLCIEESDNSYAFVLTSLQEMEPRRKLSSIKVIFVDGFLSNNFTTKLGVPSTVLFLDSYHLLNCIWPDALGERAYNLVKEHLQTMVFCHSQQDYDRAFTEIITKLQHMPEKLAKIEEYYGNPSVFACYRLMTVRGTMCKRGSAHAEQNHASIDTHIPTFGGILEPEVFIEKLILRHDEWVSKHEKLRRDVLFTSSAMACNTADKTLSSAVQNLSRYSYEIFKKEYFGAQKYIGESRECNYNIEEYVILQTACDGTRCAKPRCVSMDFQCRHELAASMVFYDDNGRNHNLFDIAKFGSRHLQQHIYLKITHQPIDNEDNYAEGVTFQAEVHDSNPAFIETPVTLAKEASDQVSIDKPVTATKAASTAYFTYSDVIKEAKNLASTIQGDKICPNEEPTLLVHCLY